jgi:mannose-6-phosphate isomerase-like protein (cupin superfamily)
MIPIHKLPISFDPEALRADVEKFGPSDWAPHFNTQYYDGDWSGVPLRAAKGATLDLYPDPVASEGHADTVLMARCDYVPKVTSAFACELETVRFLKLGAGSSIREHRDYMLNIEDGVARIHIPVVTDPRVVFILGGERVDMRPGEAWYLDFNRPHSVRNESTIDRVHLVIDCIVNEWMRSLFPR